MSDVSDAEARARALEMVRALAGVSLGSVGEIGALILGRRARQRRARGAMPA